MGMRRKRDVNGFTRSEKDRQWSGLGNPLGAVGLALSDGKMALRRAADFGGAKMGRKAVNSRRWKQ